MTETDRQLIETLSRKIGEDSPEEMWRLYRQTLSQVETLEARESVRDYAEVITMIEQAQQL